MFKGIKGIAKTIENEAEEQKGVFLVILLNIIGAISLGNLLGGKVVYADDGFIQAFEEKIRTEQDF